MNYSDYDMERYYSSLPPNAKDFINLSGVEISTFGQLLMIGEHFRHGLEDSENL